MDWVYEKPWQDEIKETCHYVNRRKKRKGNKIKYAVKYTVDAVVLAMAMIIFMAGIWQIAKWVSVLVDSI